MRLLRLSDSNEFAITDDLVGEVPPYVILSHTWGARTDEVTFTDLQRQDLVQAKAGYAKIEFCAQRAREDCIEHFWIDTCCIDRANLTELSEAITSMFQWYRKAVKCYVFLSDVASSDGENLESSLRTSRWFTRGWTLQELLAPEIVEFYSRDAVFLGTKKTLMQTIQEITGVPTAALDSAPLSDFSVDERMRWALRRETTKKEDQAYCLLGIFDVSMPLIYGEGDKAFRRLSAEIKKHLEVPEKASHTHWCVPRSRNPVFTGRRALLRELECSIYDAVNSPCTGTQCRVVISGVGGQGKSEICLQLAHRLRDIFWAVMWVDVSTPNIAEASFLDVARRLSIPSQTGEDARLGISSLDHPWLLVLDNADDNMDYLDYFPDGPLGVVLLTSRNEECHQYATADPVVLPGLEEEDALQLLLRASNMPQAQHESLRDDVRVVARLLQSHPLALIQAGAYISRGHCTFGRYPQAFEEQRKRLLAFRSTQAKPRHGDVYTTFEVSANALRAAESPEARDALQLVHLLAMCAPNRLPLSIFEAAWEGSQILRDNVNGYAEDDGNRHLTSWHTSHLPSFLDATQTHWDSFRLTEATAILKTFSLISLHVHENSTYVSMHPLVHAWASERQHKDEQHSSWLRAGCTIAFALAAETLSQRDQRWLRAHVEALTEWKSTQVFAQDPPDLIIRVLVRFGSFLNEGGIRRKSFELTQRTMEHLQLKSSQVQASWIILYELAATSSLRDGKPQPALELLKQIVEIWKRSLSVDDSRLLNSQHYLGETYRINGQPADAVALLEHVVAVRERTLTEDHSDRLWSQHALGVAYRGTGQLEEAVTILKRVAESRHRVLAEDDPYLLMSQHELGAAYRQSNQLEEAITLLKHVMTVRVRVFAESHPGRLWSQHELGTAYRQIGRLEEAMPLLEHVATVRDRILDEEHLDRLWSRYELAVCLWELKRYQSALAMMTEVVATGKRALRDNHSLLEHSEGQLDRMRAQMTQLGISGDEVT